MDGGAEVVLLVVGNVKGVVLIFRVVALVVLLTDVEEWDR